MPWLLQRLAHGEPPGAYSWVDDDYQPDVDEVLSATDPAGTVWDETAQSLRDRTPEEQQTRDTTMLQITKQKKRAELVDAADAAYRQEIPSFAGVVVAAKFVPPNNTQYLSAAELTIFNKISAGYSKLNTLLDQVTAATTIEQVQGIVW